MNNDSNYKQFIKRRVAKNCFEKNESRRNIFRFKTSTSSFLLEVFRKRNLETGIRPFLVSPVTNKMVSGLSIDWNYGDTPDRIIPERYVEPIKLDIKRVRLIEPVCYTKDVEKVPRDVLLKFKTYSHGIEFKTIMRSNYFKNKCDCFYINFNIKHLLRKWKNNDKCLVCSNTRIIPIPLTEFYND